MGTHSGSIICQRCNIVCHLKRCIGIVQLTDGRLQNVTVSPSTANLTFPHRLVVLRTGNMTGCLGKLNTALYTKAKLLGIFYDIVDSLSGSCLIEKVVTGYHQCILNIDWSMQTQTTRIIICSGLINLLTVNQGISINDTGCKRSNTDNRLINRTRHINTLCTVVD